MTHDELREKVARWFVNDLGYSDPWPDDLTPPPWSFEQADRILALFEGAVGLRDSRALCEAKKLLRVALPNRAMLDDDKVRSWYDSREKWVAALRSLPPAEPGLRHINCDLDWSNGQRPCTCGLSTLLGEGKGENT